MDRIEEFKALLDSENVKYRLVGDVGSDLFFVISPVEAGRHKIGVVMHLLRNGHGFNLYCSLPKPKVKATRAATLEALNRLNRGCSPNSSTNYYLDDDDDDWDIAVRQVHFDPKSRRVPGAAVLSAWIKYFREECSTAVDTLEELLRPKPAIEETGYLNLDPFASTEDI